MIDPHVHLRDWKQASKETVKHGLSVAYRAGLDAIFEMPNTDPPLTSREKIEERILLADRAIKELGLDIFHGLYAGLTANPDQIEEVVKAYDSLFPRVVGLKMFAGHSTGNMGIIDEEEQRKVFRTLAELGFEGVLAVHCEKEEWIDERKWKKEKPITHSHARPPEAEVNSKDDMINFAHQAGYKGTMHICHASFPATVYGAETSRKNVDFNITMGVTPHHLRLWAGLMNVSWGVLLKVNPPLRPKGINEELLDLCVAMGRIDWFETDHAPHTLEDKLERHASGIPGLHYYPHFISWVRGAAYLSEDTIDDMTHNNIVKTFGIDIPNTKREPDYGLLGEYETDPYSKIHLIR